MYNAQELVKRIKIQAISKNIKVSKMLKDLGLSHSFLSDTIKSKNGMTIANFCAIACYLGVSADYLLSISDNPNILK